MNIIQYKTNYYKEQKKHQMTTELVSCLLEGKTVGQACDITMDIFPKDYTYVDVATGIVEVFD